MNWHCCRLGARAGYFWRATHRRAWILLAAYQGLTACSTREAAGALEVRTIADATRGTQRWVDAPPSGPSPGDTLVFDQPLMDADGRRDIGTNSGFCITTRPGIQSQCQWTLTLHHGSLTVAGPETVAGSSRLPVIGATGHYAHWTGELETFPNANGTFTQIVRLRPGP